MMVHLRIACRYLALATLAVTTIGSATAHAQQRALFSDADVVMSPASRTATGEPMVVRSRRATVDLSLIAAAGAGSASGVRATQAAARSIPLNLFADVDLIAQLDHVELVQPFGYAWVGEIAGATGSTVVLAVADGTLTGSIEVSGKLYSVRRVDQSYVIAEIDRQQIPGDDIALPPGGARVAAAAAAPASTDSGDVFDLLLYYTTGVKNALGGDAAVNSFITGSIARVNSAYAASNISMRVRLVAALETPYVDSGSTQTDLSALRDNAEVRAARDQYGADIVSMLVTRDPAASGRGYVSVSRGTVAPEAGYNVVVYYTYIGYIYSLAHELGHNQGCLHEPGNNGADDTSGAYSYSLGYTDVAAGFHDIMSYGNGCTNCTYLNEFSSPNNQYQGRPTGTATQDNARTINETRAAIANYRAAVAADALTPPTGLAASASGSTVTLGWSAPSSGTPSAYVIEAGSASGLANLTSFSTGSTATAFSASGVGAGTYYVRVRATNAGGASAPSNEVTLIVR